MKCLICGMDININNFDTNNEGLLEENQTEYIRYCPFCGVSSKYLTSENEIFDKSEISNKDETYSKKEMYKVTGESLDEHTLLILDHAMKLEIFNSEFYMSASKLAHSENVKGTFEALSKIERMHAIVHQKLGGFEGLPKLVDIDYSKYENDESLLELAENREIHAAKFYEKHAKEINNSIVKGVLIALLSVERDHIKIAGNY